MSTIHHMMLLPFHARCPSIPTCFSLHLLIFPHTPPQSYSTHHASFYFFSIDPVHDGPEREYLITLVLPSPRREKNFLSPTAHKTVVRRPALKLPLNPSSFQRSVGACAESQLLAFLFSCACALRLSTSDSRSVLRPHYTLFSFSPRKCLGLFP